jgi:hypothetical protein
MRLTLFWMGFGSGFSGTLLASFSVMEATLFWPRSRALPSFNLSSKCLMFLSMSANFAANLE